MIRSRRCLLMFGAVAAALTLAGPAQARPGQVDTSFGSGGTVAAGVTQLIGVTTKGRIVLATEGERYADDTTSVTISELLSDGRLDRSFGDAGRVGLRLPAGGRTGLIDAAGGIVIAGCNFSVVRLTSSGQLDTSFANSGLNVPCSYDGAAWDIAAQPDGKLVLAGYVQFHAGSYNGFVERLLPNGRPDPEFRTFDDDAEYFAGGYDAVAIQPNGHIVAAGSAGLVRLYSGGTPDPNFDADVELSTSGTPGFALQADGRMLIASGYGPNHSPQLERLMSNGRLDPSFVSQPLVQGGQIHVQVNGKIVVVSHEATTAGAGRSTVRRFLPDGRPDLSFGSQGKVVVGPRSSEFFTLSSLLQADGRILLTDHEVVARLLGDPVPACEGKRPTVSGAGLVLGTNGDDVITTGDGTDRVSAGAGNDLVCTFGGNDTLLGGLGNDRLNGGVGTDTADGGPGTDTGTQNESQVAIP